MLICTLGGLWFSAASVILTLPFLVVMGDFDGVPWRIHEFDTGGEKPTTLFFPRAGKDSTFTIIRYTPTFCRVCLICTLD